MSVKINGVEYIEPVLIKRGTIFMLIREYDGLVFTEYIGGRHEGFCPGLYPDVFDMFENMEVVDWFDSRKD